MRRLGMLVAVTVLLVSCGGGADGPTVPVAESFTPYAGQTDAGEVVAAARPTESVFEQVLEGPDPCSGVWQVLTHTLTCRLQQAEGAEVMTCKRKIVTDPTGYVGRGNMTQVVNGNILNLRYTEILKNDVGDRVKARAHGLLDLSTGTWTIYFFEAVCLGQ